jgi:hypothetical protein
MASDNHPASRVEVRGPWSGSGAQRSSKCCPGSIRCPSGSSSRAKLQARPSHPRAPDAACTRSRTAPPPHSAAEQELVERLTRAFENSDVEAIVALLSEDVQFAMPPLDTTDARWPPASWKPSPSDAESASSLRRPTVNPRSDCTCATPAAGCSMRWDFWCSRSPATRSAPSHASTRACSPASDCRGSCPGNAAAQGVPGGVPAEGWRVV